MTIRKWWLGIFLAGLLGSPSLATAQQPPNTIIISATSGRATWNSVDYNDTFGTPPMPSLTSFRAEYYLKSAVTVSGTAPNWVFTPSGTPIITADWGKPVPDAMGLITGPFLQPQIQPNVEYYLFLREVGPQGVSPQSNGAGPFGFPPLPRAVVGVKIQ